ncbi:MAG: GTP-binding protein [Candidatus Lokiarchaeota archaeon]
MSKRTNRLYKIVIVGEGGVGKTTILHQYVDDKFVEDTKMTVGSNFFIKKINLNKNGHELTVLFQIWDLAGQEQFSYVRPSFYRGAKGIIYVFDLTNRFSFHKLTKWQKEVEDAIGMQPNLLVGNKLDLVKEDRYRIDDFEIEHMLNELGSEKYIMTSAKEDIKIDEVFHNLAQLILKKISKN